MITNLFSIFDPSLTNTFSLNWIRSLIRIIILPIIFWFIPSRINILLIKIVYILSKEFNLILKSSQIKRTSLFFISLFIFILFNNIIRLFPYIFSRTRHLTLTLSLSLPLWLTFILYGWINIYNSIFIHLIPEGTPNILIPFIVCVETISNIIRPITLAVRLTANIIAGHLILTLIGGLRINLSLSIINLIIMSQILLLILELRVRIIQSYVFSILITLYLREISYVK